MIRPGVLCALALGVAWLTLAASPVSAQQPREVDIELPGANVILHESAHDHLKVTAFSRAVGDSRINAYLRVQGQDRFVEKKDYQELVPAPKGGRVAGEPQSSPGEFNSVVIFDAKGKPTRIRTVRKPLEATSIQWSRDGRKLVLTIEKKLSTVGFVTIDVAKRTVKVVKVRGVDPFSAFQWTPDGKHLAVGYADPHQGVRLYRTDGRVHRTLRRIGWIIGDDAFSPSGKQLLTVCPPTYAESSYCLWNVRSGKLAKRVKINFASTQGWWDERHLISVVSGEGAQLVVVIDLKGKVSRVLAHDRARLGRGVALVYTPGH